MLNQVISVVGALLVLAAYLLLQLRRLSREDRLFNALNLVGSALLTWIAIEDRRVGFILLEGAWALLSLPGTVRPRRAG